MISPFLYFLYFLKASLFSTGGLSNLPSLRQDLLAHHWAAESDFGHSVVIGQLSPGPTGLWVVSLGYLTYGVVGAICALVAVTLPGFFVLFIAAGYDRIQRLPWIQGAMRGVSLAVIGILTTVAWTILRQPGVDWRGLLIALGAFALAASRKMRLPFILAIAGAVGFFIYR